MKRLTFVLVVLAAASSAAFYVVCVPKVEAKRAGVRLDTREVALGRAQAGELKGTRTVSRDRRHIAFVAKVANGEAAYVDGVAGKTYPAVASDPLSEAGLGSPFTFSRDGRRAAYVVLSNESRARGPRRVVVDGMEGPSFDYVWSGGLHFSDDGKHFAYTGERGGKRFAVVDGVEHGPYERVGSPAFRSHKDGSVAVAFDATRDGRQLLVVNGQEFPADDPRGRERFFGEDAAWAREVVREGKHFVVWQGKEVGPFNEQIGTSLRSEPRAGGRLVVFEGKRDGKQFAVVDGVEGKPYDYVGPIYVSPGGEHTLYPVRSGKESFVVLDGKEGPKFSNVNIAYGASPFSPDGLHYAYAASREDPPDLKFLVVTDGKEGKLYDFVTGVTYTPDGAHLLYLAFDRLRWRTFLVRDGEEVASYEQLSDGDIRFGPDGKRMYFRLRPLGEEKGQEAVVVDGRAFSYDNILDVEFSPDGRRFVLKGQRGRGWVMVVDGVESEVYEPDGERGELVWSRDGRLAFSKDGGRMAYVGRKGGKDFVVLDGSASGTRYDSIANLAFTPDGRHVVYTARRAAKSLVVVDGVESRAYDAFLPARDHEREGTLNVEGNTTLSILARRGAELLRVEIEIDAR